jgi:branched-chain amino acid aminotransferase
MPTVLSSALYPRPTLIGTRPALAISASEHAALYVLASPTGSFFAVPRSLRLWVHTCAWPGGTGVFKLGDNYATGFAPPRAGPTRCYGYLTRARCSAGPARQAG